MYNVEIVGNCGIELVALEVISLTRFEMAAAEDMQGAIAGVREHNEAMAELCRDFCQSTTIYSARLVRA